MTERQFKAWLRIKLSNLSDVCYSLKPERILERLDAISNEAERRKMKIRPGKQ